MEEQSITPSCSSSSSITCTSTEPKAVVRKKMKKVVKKMKRVKEESVAAPLGSFIEETSPKRKTKPKVKMSGKTASTTTKKKNKKLMSAETVDKPSITKSPITKSPAKPKKKKLATLTLDEDTESPKKKGTKKSVKKKKKKVANPKKKTRSSLVDPEKVKDDPFRVIQKIVYDKPERPARGEDSVTDEETPKVESLHLPPLEYMVPPVEESLVPQVESSGTDAVPLQIETPTLVNVEEEQQVAGRRAPIRRMQSECSTDSEPPISLSLRPLAPSRCYSSSSIESGPPISLSLRPGGFCNPPPVIRGEETDYSSSSDSDTDDEELYNKRPSSPLVRFADTPNYITQNGDYSSDDSDSSSDSDDSSCSPRKTSLRTSSVTDCLSPGLAPLQQQVPTIQEVSESGLLDETEATMEESQIEEEKIEQVPIQEEVAEEIQSEESYMEETQIEETEHSAVNENPEVDSEEEDESDDSSVETFQVASGEHYLTSYDVQRKELARRRPTVRKATPSIRNIGSLKDRMQGLKADVSTSPALSAPLRSSLTLPPAEQEDNNLPVQTTTGIECVEEQRKKTTEGRPKNLAPTKSLENIGSLQDRMKMLNGRSSKRPAPENTTKLTTKESGKVEIHAQERRSFQDLQRKARTQASEVLSNDEKVPTKQGHADGAFDFAALRKLARKNAQEELSDDDDCKFTNGNRNASTHKRVNRRASLGAVPMRASGTSGAPQRQAPLRMPSKSLENVGSLKDRIQSLSLVPSQAAAMQKSLAGGSKQPRSTSCYYQPARTKNPFEISSNKTTPTGAAKPLRRASMTSAQPFPASGMAGQPFSLGTKSNAYATDNLRPQKAFKKKVPVKSNFMGGTPNIPEWRQAPTRNKSSSLDGVVSIKERVQKLAVGSAPSGAPAQRAN